MATLANIDGVAPARNATETVKHFADRYFHRANPVYARPAGQSLIRLLWDAYRNGGLHRFFPKAGTLPVGGQQINVTFGVSWFEVAIPGGKRSATVVEARTAQASAPRLIVHSTGRDSYQVWIVAQLFILDFIEAVETWLGELTPAPDLGPWFIDGANALEAGMAPGRHAESLACLADLVTTATPVP